MTRQFTVGDADRPRDLYGTVCGHERTAEWFDPRFRANPAADRVRCPDPSPRRPT
ncbi:hypothetical protein ACOZ4N_03490 [Halorientalis pallida]|uniref:hypothetical protein n=1 Tax=Halorientalis pallida TaxID=2479928 RepID=UPI003C6EC898